MKRLMIFGIAAVLFLCATANAEMRIWTSKKGDTIEAEYVKMYGSKVVLKTANGKTLHVPAGGLCDDDQEYLSHLTAVPPKIQIEVDDDLERDKKGAGYYLENEEQRVTCNVVVKKTNSEPCLGNFKARLYVIGEEKEGTKKKILGIKEQAFSFARQDATEFSLTATAKSRVGYMWAEGFEYEGYLVCVEDDSGEMIAMESNQNAYERHMDVILKSSQGNIFTEDFVKTN
jgi:hypothetical protein